MVKNFTDHLNETILKDKIKFEPVIKETGLEFLDLKVHLKNGYLIPEINSNETDSHEYLNPNSIHPLSVTKSNPYSVALKVRWNCSDRKVDDKLFVNNLIQYKAYLMHSGYEEEAIDKQFIKVAKMKRKETLESKPRKNKFGPEKKEIQLCNHLGSNVSRYYWRKMRNATNFSSKDPLEWLINGDIRT